MTLEAASQVVDLMTAQVSEDANVIWGARQDPGFGDTIKVMAIITGVGRRRSQSQAAPADPTRRGPRLTARSAPAPAWDSTPTIELSRRRKAEIDPV